MERALINKEVKEIIEEVEKKDESLKSIDENSIDNVNKIKMLNAKLKESSDRLK